MGNPSGPRPGSLSVPRLRWWFVFTLLAGSLLGAGLVLSRGYASPIQPMRFNHKIHVKQAKCPACHTTVTKSAVAGAPKLADCLDCHEGAQAKTPAGKQEEAKLEAYAKAKTEIPWMRVWRLPPHVFFSHRTHVTVAKLECKTCHGPMETLEEPPRRPLKTLTMNDCIGCHEKWERPSETAAKGMEPVKATKVERASTDCNACHR